MNALLWVAMAVTAHSVDFWVYTECVVADYEVCPRMVTIPTGSDEYMLMCCQHIVPHYMAELSNCQPTAVSFDDQSKPNCPEIVTAGGRDTGWCCGTESRSV